MNHQEINRLFLNKTLGDLTIISNAMSKFEYRCNICGRKLTEEEVEEMAGDIPEYPEKHSYVCQKCVDEAEINDEEKAAFEAYKVSQKIT